MSIAPLIGAGTNAITSAGSAANPILGGLQILSGLSGLFGSKKKSLAQRQQEKLNKLNIHNLEALTPFLRQIQGGATATIDPLLQNALKANQVAAQYDPAKNTENLLRTYDASARDSINADLGNITAGSAARGFTKGTGDSDTGARLNNVLARRATDRAMYASNLKANEVTNGLNVTGQAFNRLQNAFGTLDPTGRSSAAAGAANATSANIGAMRGYNDAQNDPTASIGMLAGGLKKIYPKLPWQ